MIFDIIRPPYASPIVKLGIANQYLIHRSINLGFFREAKQLQRIDQHLLWLLHKSASFDYVETVAKGRTLLIGEGNLSFVLSLAKMDYVVPSRLIATTFDSESDWSSVTKDNAKELRSLGVTVLAGVNAGDLAKTFGSWLFDNIIFQFPHAGSRVPVEGHNPNFILVRDFLLNAASQLQSGGQVLISTVDSPHYRGAFHFDEAATIAGFLPPQTYPFDPEDFSGYEHTMTHDSGNAIDNHDKFSTWVFKLK